MSVFKFERRAEQDEPATREKGEPIWKDEIYVIIRADERSCTSMRAEDWFGKLRDRVKRADGQEREMAEEAIERARRAYKRFQEGLEPEIEGRPLHTWPRMTPALIASLNHRNVFSVEDCAEMKDSICEKIPNGLRLREEAKRYIEEATGTAALATRNAELEATVEAMKAELAELRLMMPKGKRAA